MHDVNTENNVQFSMKTLTIWANSKGLCAAFFLGNRGDEVMNLA
jgi:hypothetical protein